MSAETLGKESWNGKFPFEWGVSAHPKVDDKTGEMLFFNYSKEAPYMHYGVVDSANELVHYVDVPLPGPRLPHDMAFTENYAILNDSLVLGSGSAGEGRARREFPSRYPAASRSHPTPRNTHLTSSGSKPILTYVLALRERRTKRGTRLFWTGFYQGDPEPSDKRYGQSVGALPSVSSLSIACRPRFTAGV